MTGKGRRKKPQENKELEGTSRQDRQNTKRPEKNLGLPKAPDWLSKEAKETYNRMKAQLQVMRVVSKEDEHALALLCQEYADYLWCREILNKEGLTIYEDRGKYTVLKKRPELEIANSKYRHVFDKLTEFGLTPASREKVKSVDNDDHEDPLEAFFN